MSLYDKVVYVIAFESLWHDRRCMVIVVFVTHSVVQHLSVTLVIIWHVSLLGMLLHDLGFVIDICFHLQWELRRFTTFKFQSWKVFCSILPATSTFSQLKCLWYNLPWNSQVITCLQNIHYFFSTCIFPIHIN